MRRFLYRVARSIGWRFSGSLPSDPKLVVIGYPHTSNADFFLFLAALGYADIDVRFLAAEGLFVGPFGWFLRSLGGIPIDQQQAQAAVGAAVEAFDAADAMILVLAPEGTRSAPSAWRSGFWRIADAADVPVVMVKVDAARRTVVFGPSHRIDGDPHRWMDEAREFYADASGLRSGRAGPVRLRTEIPGT